MEIATTGRRYGPILQIRGLLSEVPSQTPSIVTALLSGVWVTTPGDPFSQILASGEPILLLSQFWSYYLSISNPFLSFQDSNNSLY